MAIILPYDLLAHEFPQAGIVVATSSDQVRRIGREGTVPHPALVAGQRALELERPRLRRRLAWRRNHGLEVLDLPDLGGVVRAARREVLDVGREEDPRDVLRVRLEVGDGHQLRLFTVLEEMPNVDATLIGGEAVSFSAFIFLALRRRETYRIRSGA